jgi:tetratricopeptide (TPR) repeat protein
MVRPRRIFSVLPFFAILLPLSSAVFAQMQTGNVHVYVTDQDERASNLQMKVALISGSNGNQVSQTMTNDHGQANFEGVMIGNYHVVVSGADIQTTESEEFEVDARKGAQSIFVKVRPNAQNGEIHGGAGGPTVSAGDFKIPKKAAQEFDKAGELIANQQWQKALDHLNKALAIYPNYAQAYTNLGVVYARLGQPDKEREALLKATAANDHFAPAFVNLARLEMRLHNFAAAEGDLQKAISAGAADAASMVLLAQAQLLNLHYEDAIVSARKVHAMFPGSHAVVHYVAARACERLQRFSDAVSELKFFLAEEPSGPLTTSARQELAAVQKLKAPPS